MKMYLLRFGIILILLLGTSTLEANLKNEARNDDKGMYTEKDIPPVEKPPIDTKEEKEDISGYKKGSVCMYCKYCKLCDLCKESCPCDNIDLCDMCKYCKYCDLCYTVCDSVCTPGGFLDIFSSAVYDALPTFSEKTKKDVEKDLDRAKDFIKEYL